MIEHETYDKVLLGRYVKRLMTKCLVAHQIAERLFQHYGVRLRVFDSPEYAVGADMLRKNHTIPQIHRDQDFLFADLTIAAEIRDMETTFAGGEYGDSMIYTTLAAVLRPDLYAMLIQRIQSGHSVRPDVRRSMHATYLAAIEGVSKRNLYRLFFGTSCRSFLVLLLRKPSSQLRSSLADLSIFESQGQVVSV